MEALVNRLCITTYHLTFMFYYGASYVTGRCFGTFLFSIIYGMSSFPLTNSNIFFKMGTLHQQVIFSWIFFKEYHFFFYFFIDWRYPLVLIGFLASLYWVVKHTPWRVGFKHGVPHHYLDDAFWVNYNDLTATSLESCSIREIIPKWP